MKDEHLLKTFNVWEELSMSQEDVIAYQSRLKYTSLRKQRIRAGHFKIKQKKK